MIFRFLTAGTLATGLLGYTLWHMKEKLKHEPIPASLTEGKAGACELEPEVYRNGHLRFEEIKNRLTPHLKAALEKQKLKLGSPVFLRSFKEERILELWMFDPEVDHYRHAQTWSIAGMSGGLGPKLEEGDKQSPEGFYQVSLNQFLPSSTNHLAFNVGYPNAFDRNHGRTGSFIMVHGKKGSVGCLAMTDAYIEEIYTICHAALESGQQDAFQIQMLPFRLTEDKLANYSEHKWQSFWRKLKPGYDHFEIHRMPPKVSISGKQYRFSSHAL